MKVVVKLFNKYENSQVAEVVYNKKYFSLFLTYKSEWDCPPYLQAHCQSHTSHRQNQSFVKELANPAQLTAYMGGFRIAHSQKTK